MSYQQDTKLVGEGSVGKSKQGSSVSISSQGNTLAIGAPGDNNDFGALYTFRNNGTAWLEQGKLDGNDGTGLKQYQGCSVAISGNGNQIVSGGYGDNSSIGAMWIFGRSGNGPYWEQLGSKIVGTGYSGASQQGYSVQISLNGAVLASGAPCDDGGTGAVWVIIVPVLVKHIHKWGPS